MRERTVRPNGSHGAKHGKHRRPGLACLVLQCNADCRVVVSFVLGFLVAAASSYGNRPRCRSQNFDLPFFSTPRVTYELNKLVASTPYMCVVYGCSLMSN